MAGPPAALLVSDDEEIPASCSARAAPSAEDYDRKAHQLMATTAPTYVYDFTQGSKDEKDLLGGKGANLAEMTRLGLPVPPGFTITTEACRSYLAAGDEPARAAGAGDDGAAPARGPPGPPARRPARPAAGRVRSGARFSMPGMMETVLNIGLNDASVKGLAEASGDERFAWDSYRRLLQMYGKTVLGIDGERFSHALEKAKSDKGMSSDLDLDVHDLQALVETFKVIVGRSRGRTSRSTRANSSTRRSARSSTRGTPTGRVSTGAGSGSPTTSARP